MPPRETSIDRLDSIESRQEPVQQPKVQEEIKPKIADKIEQEGEAEDEADDEIEDDTNTPSKILLNSDTLILLIILLVSMHPGVNLIFNNYVKLGGFTFIAKALSVLGLYIIFKYFI
jgi:hypothetical protein